MDDLNLLKRDDESDLQYHKRIIEGKLVDKTLADYDYAELSKYAYGKEYAADHARKMFYGSQRTLQLIDEDCMNRVDDELLSELDMKKFELQKERQKFSDYRAAFNKILRERSRQEELNDILVKAIADSDLPVLNYVPHDCEPSDNDLLVSLNDIHYGADIKNYWNTYNSDVCAEMFVRYIDKILEIQKIHNSENCIIWCNGDEISGSIHHSIAVTNKENVIDQIKGVSELIAEFLAALSPHFKNVIFVSVPGNHSRMDTKDRALLSERLDDLVGWYLDARLRGFENVFISDNRIDDTMYLIDVRGKLYAGVHGDVDESPSKIQAIQTMVGQPLYAVLTGHKHHNKVDVVQGIKVVMGGSFMGVDDYCVSKRIFGRPEQIVCVCDQNGIQCTYDVPLN